jgi:hypothetical protein
MENMKLQILGNHLTVLQTNLSEYEKKLLTNERSAILKGMVEYYREETKLVGRYLMGLVVVIRDENSPPIPVPMPVPVPVPQSPLEPEEEAPVTKHDPSAELPPEAEDEGPLA